MLTERQVGFLLEELCVSYGLCLPPQEIERLLTDVPSGPESFALAVGRAEGLEPTPSHRQLYYQVLAHVERAYDRVKPPTT